MRNVEDLIGNTPLVELKKTQEKYALKGKIFAKVEFYNPAGSIKDRVAKAIVEDAERTGKLKVGGTIIEATSGNTGIGLALVAAARGYQAVIVMPDNMSVERQKLIKAYGAKIVLTEGSKGMQGAVDKAEELLKNTPNAIVAGQFENPANPAAHYETTAPEIYAQTEGKTDIFVCGVGTGGTITGVGKYLKEKNAQTRVVAVEPSNSPLLSKGVAGKHGIQGIGANFLPKTLDRGIYDEVIAVSDEDAFLWAREASKTEGLFVGISSGAALAAAIELAKREENADKNIVVIFPDGGGRYLSIL
ncbi:MAG: cysteine synthase A [Clostridia bacterium]|nr:cysteine synthase A [Clostridia bacterium]